MNNQTLHKMIEALMPAYYSGKGNTFIPRARNEDRKKSGKTRRGAVHKSNPTFRSRNLMKITPAQYRHWHFGVVKKKESKKDGH